MPGYQSSTQGQGVPSTRLGGQVAKYVPKQVPSLLSSFSLANLNELGTFLPLLPCTSSCSSTEAVAQTRDCFGEQNPDTQAGRAAVVRSSLTSPVHLTVFSPNPINRLQGQEGTQASLVSALPTVVPKGRQKHGEAYSPAAASPRRGKNPLQEGQRNRAVRPYRHTSPLVTLMDVPIASRWRLQRRREKQWGALSDAGAGQRTRPRRGSELRHGTREKHRVAPTPQQAESSGCFNSGNRALRRFSQK